MIYLLVFCQSTLIIIFLLATIGKLRDFEAFEQTIGRLQMLPSALNRLATSSIIGLELLTIVWLAIPSTRYLGFGLAFILLGGFSLVIWLTLQRQLTLACNCFGPSQRSISAADLRRNLGLIILASLGLILHTNIDLSQNVPWSIWLTIGIGSAGFVAFWLQLPHIWQFFQFK